MQRRSGFEKYLTAEDRLHKAVLNYLALKGIPCHHSPMEGKRGRVAQWKLKYLGSEAGFPDIFIMRGNGEYCGLFLELKAEGVTIFNKDGTLRSGDHLRRQALYLEKLRKEGFKAEFAVGFDQAKSIIDEYFK